MEGRFKVSSLTRDEAGLVKREGKRGGVYKGLKRRVGPCLNFELTRMGRAVKRRSWCEMLA